MAVSSDHRGNIQNELILEEHDGLLNAKRISLISGATIYAVVNTAGAGNTTLNPSPNFIGLVSIAQPINSNVSLSASAQYIGLASVNIGGTLPALVAGTAFIGLATVNIGSSNTVAITGNVTVNPSPNFIGLVSIAQPINANVSLSASANYIGLASVNIGGGSVGINSNVTLNPSPNFIGLATVNLGQALPAGTANIGDVDVLTLPAIPAGANYIGLATVDIGSNRNVAILGNVTISDSRGYIGLATVTPASAWPNPNTYIGLATVSNAVAWPDPKTFIGLATVVPTFLTGYTCFATVISLTGPATIVVPPAGQKIFVKDVQVSSLGRSHFSAWKVNSTATAANIPWTSLATNSYFTRFYGDNGTQWGIADQALTFALNGAATVGVGVCVRFAA